MIKTDEIRLIIPSYQSPNDSIDNSFTTTSSTTSTTDSTFPTITFTFILTSSTIHTSTPHPPLF